VKCSRLKLGLVLVSLLAFVLATPPNLSAARHPSSKSATAKKVSTGKGKPKTAAKPAGKAKATGKTHGRPSAKESAGATAKGHSRKSAGSAKGSARSSSRRSAKGSTRAATKAESQRSRKTVYRQQQPEPERIREIQQALNEHGYPLEVSGAWDASTVDALKKFQTEQKIDNLSGKGKLDSMTLIALGLGPKREPPSGQTEAPRQTPEGKLP
jgi:hypothetical protein